VKRALILVFILACHHEVKEELHLNQAEQDNSAKTTEETGAKTKTQAATEVDTKTTRSDNAVVIQDADGSATVAVVPRDKPLALKKGAKVIGTVPVSQTVIVQTQHIGGTVSTENTAETTNTVTDVRKLLGLDSKKEVTTDIGFSLKFYLLAGSSLIALVALVFTLLKSKRIRLLLGLPV